MPRILTFGVYDYFHLGHLRLFKQAKQYADYLIVAVQDGDYILKFKPETRIFYTTEERVELISALRIVDEVYIYQSICAETLSEINFDILALGEDHKGKRFDEAVNWCIAHEKKIVRLRRTPGIASSDIKKNL